jgi:TolB-like protein/DNA-binding winged helix-turn-helix (wHTH) protein/tetratricopeptide (TPR) repeat protein
MVLTPTQSRILKFAVFEVDLEAGELRKSGLRQKLTGQPFEVLRLLLERPQEIVTREELQQRIWPKDTFVDYDLALRKAITRLRDALGDSAESPRFIETIPRRGYRFIAPLSPSSDSRVAGLLAQKAHPCRGLRIGITMGVAAAVVGAVLALVPSARHRIFGEAATPRIRSLAVLPLENLSADPAQEYFSDGLTDALITDLAQIGGVKIISRTSTIQYKRTKKSLPEVARELNVDGVVEGTVQRFGDRVRITVQLIHASSDTHIWASSYERDMRDVLVLERDVTEDVARQVQARLTTENQAVAPRPVKPEALDAYLQGNYYLNRYGKGGGGEEKARAAEYFQQAIAADPNFAPAYKGLADAHYAAWPSSQDAAIVINATNRALELDPNFADARVILAEIKFFHDWDFRGGEQEVRRAIALSPNSAGAHTELCALLYFMGRTDEALRECRVSQELDPTGDHQRDADTLYWAGEDDRAIAFVQMLLQTDPDDGFLHHALYRYYSRKGMYKEAAAEAERVLALFGDADSAVRVHRVLVISGGRAALRQAARELEQWIITKRAYVPGNLAADYAILDDKDRAFYWLDEAYKHHDLRWLTTDIPLESLKSERMFDSLRSDPRYDDLVRRIGLPQ